MRNLMTHLSQIAQPNLIGVEKSGPFVEHAHQIQTDAVGTGIDSQRRLYLQKYTCEWYR